MPVQPPPVTSQQNQTQHVGQSGDPENNRRSDPAPAGRAKILIGAVLLVLITAGVVTFLTERANLTRLQKKPKPSRFRPSRWCTLKPSPETTSLCCPEICRL